MRHLQNPGSSALPNQTGRSTGGTGSMKSIVTRTVYICLLLLFFTAATTVLAQKKDDSGTNPVSFTYDFRIWNETQALPGENTFSKMAFEYRVPFSARWAGRFRGYVSNLNSGGQSFDGLGDVDARILHIALLKKKWALAFGLEATLNSATQKALGSGKTTLGPQVFLAFFNPLGVKGVLFAPAYQYVFHIAGDDDRADISRSQVDLFFVWLASSKKNWAVFNPHIIIDHERETETLVIEAELGQMMFGPTSSYIRPGFHAAGDELFDWNIEFGFKVIWR